MSRGAWPALLLALSAALGASPFSGRGSGPIGVGGPPAASDTVAGTRKVTTSGPWYIVAPFSTSVSVTNVAAATADFNANRHMSADWTGQTKCRICENLSSGNLAGLKLGAQYSLDSGSTWVFLDGTADGDLGSEGPQVSLAATGWQCSSYTNLADAAKAPVRVRAVTDDGDATADPAFITIYLECR